MNFFKCIKSYPHFSDDLGFYHFINGVNDLLKEGVVGSPQHILSLLKRLANYENMPFTEQTQKLCGTRFLEAAKIFIHLHKNKLTLSDYLSYSKRNLQEKFIDAIKLLTPLFPHLSAETIAKIKQCKLDKYEPLFYLLNQNKMLSPSILKIVFDSPPLLRALLNLTRNIKNSQEYIELVIKCPQDPELFVASLLSLQNLGLLVTINEKFPSFMAQFDNLPLVVTLLLRLCTVGCHEDCLYFLANKTERQLEAISRTVYLLTKVGRFTQEEFIKITSKNGHQKSASSRLPVTDAEFSARPLSEQSTESANSLEDKLSTANSPEITKSTPAQKLKKSWSSANLFPPICAPASAAENIEKIDAHIKNCL